MDTFISRYEKTKSHIMIPTTLFSHPNLKHLSGEALLLFGLLLSVQECGDEKDEEGRKCVHVTLKEISEIFRCGKDRASRIYHELDNEIHPLVFTKKYADGHTVSYVTTAP